MSLKPTSLLMFTAHLAFYSAVGVAVVAAQPPDRTGTGRVLFDFDNADTSENGELLTTT
ncbi:MAG: hypothetical protein R3C56_19390 [Pirellulaceae bacterium]